MKHQVKPTLNPNFWDCDCENQYIHDNREESCSICHAEMDISPDSHLVETILARHKKGMFSDYAQELNDNGHFTENTLLSTELCEEIINWLSRLSAGQIRKIPLMLLIY